MTPAARVSAAIEVLDAWLQGKAAEAALLAWSRRSRFAGSKDRAAVRDHVFDAVRCARSYAALGGAKTGRGLMLGALRSKSEDVDQIFNGARFAPTKVTDSETGRMPEPGAEAHDLPDWLWLKFQDSLGDDADAAAQALRNRAPQFLRVNTRKCTPEEARAALAQDDIEAEPVPNNPTALRVVSGAQYLRKTSALLDGRLELQDAASQSVLHGLPLSDGARVLDYCSGGGGKALALAAQWNLDLVLHDADFNRMADVPSRAARAGVHLFRRSTDELEKEAPFDLALCDAPCSGSGAWRRAPDGKWRLTREALQDITTLQLDILLNAARFVRPNGYLVYVTCSVLTEENEDVVQALQDKIANISLLSVSRWPISQDGDGFFRAIMRFV